MQGRRIFRRPFLLTGAVRALEWATDSSQAARARIVQSLSLQDYITRHDALYRQACAARAPNAPSEAA